MQPGTIPAQYRLALMRLRVGSARKCESSAVRYCVHTHTPAGAGAVGRHPAGPREQGEYRGAPTVVEACPWGLARPLECACRMWPCNCMRGYCMHSVYWGQTLLRSSRNLPCFSSNSLYSFRVIIQLLLQTRCATHASMRCRAPARVLQVMVLGATNRPFDIDEAVLRRFTHRVGGLQRACWLVLLACLFACVVLACLPAVAGWVAVTGWLAGWPKDGDGCRACRACRHSLKVAKAPPHMHQLHNAGTARLYSRATSSHVHPASPTTPIPNLPLPAGPLPGVCGPAQQACPARHPASGADGRGAGARCRPRQVNFASFACYMF